MEELLKVAKLGLDPTDPDFYRNSTKNSLGRYEKKN